MSLVVRMERDTNQIYLIYKAVHQEQYTQLCTYVHKEVQGDSVKFLRVKSSNY